MVFRVMALVASKLLHNLHVQGNTVACLNRCLNEGSGIRKPGMVKQNLAVFAGHMT